MEHATPKTPIGRDMNFPLIGTIAVISVLVVFSTIVFTEAWFFSVKNRELESKSMAVVNQTRNDLRISQLQRIGTYRKVDEKHGVYAIPIERAMELVVQERGGSTSVSTAPRLESQVASTATARQSH